MRKVVFLVCGLFVCIAMDAQGLMKQKICNFGIKAGLNSMLPDIRSIGIESLELANAHAIYDVGYSIELLGRINIDRLFVQPSIAWRYTHGDILFDIVQPPLEGMLEPQFNENSLMMEIKTLEVPVMIGYSLVKEGPYVLGLMVGTKFKYNYDIRYASMWHTEHDKSYSLSLYSAVEVIIGRLVFDFGYERGLNNMYTTFDYMPNASDRQPMKLKKRIDGLNLSIGILF